MFWLVGRLILSARALAASRGVQLAAGGAVVSDFLNLDWFNQQAIKIAPGSDKAAIVDAARLAARLLGLAGDEVLWPVHRRGALQGEPITPMYLVVDLTKGRAWFSSRYKSTKRRRFFRPYRSRWVGGWNRGAQSGSVSVIK